MAAIKNERDILLQATNPRLLSVPGNFITLVPNSSSIATTDTGTNPTTVQIEVIFFGVLAGTVSWSLNPSISYTDNGNSIDISGGNIPIGSPVEVTATLNFLGEVYEATTTIIRSPEVVSYKLLSSSSSVVNEGAGIFTPTTLTFNSTKTSGSSGELVAYNGRFDIDISTDGTSFSNLFTSSSDQSTYNYTPNASHKLVKARLYKAGGFSTLLDELVIPIIPESSTDLSDVLFKSAANILTGTIVPQNTGAIRVGTISWNSITGALTGGTGIAITEWGLIGANNGTPKFTIESATGNAIFAGTLSAATGSFIGDITGGANIEISGKGNFLGGTTLFGYNSAIHANGNQSALHGLVAFAPVSGGVAIRANGGGNNYGLIAQNSSSTLPSIDCSNSGGGYGLRVTNGGINSSGLVVVGSGTSINQTSSSASSILRNLTVINGLTVSSGTLSCGTFQTSSTATVANLKSQYSQDADALAGYGVNNFCRYMETQSGNAIVSSSRMRIQMSGSLATAYRFIGSGFTISATDVSDISLKQDINPETLGLTFINSLQPKTFKLKESPDLIHHGFIAQDMTSIFPEPNIDSLYTESLVDGIKGVGYIAMIGPLVKAIQELSQTVDTLQSQVDSLLNV